jgi:hypothetical protein
MWFAGSLIASIAALFVVMRGLRRRLSRRRLSELNAGQVSDAWLAEQRGRKDAG